MLIEDSRDTAALIEDSHARCLDDLDALLEKGGGGATLQFVDYVKEKGPKGDSQGLLLWWAHRRVRHRSHDRRCAAAGNLLTNYTIDLSDVDGESLWLCSYYYEAAQAYRDEKGPKGLPVAGRRDGWSFLLADAKDMQRLNRVTLDGETVLAQIASELVDVSELLWASEVADLLTPQIAQFNRLLESTGAERAEDLGIPATILQDIASSYERGESGEPRF